MNTVLVIGYGSIGRRHIFNLLKYLVISFFTALDTTTILSAFFKKNLKKRVKKNLFKKKVEK